MTVAIGAQILHESNFKADKEVEVIVGTDNVVRINVDGVCALRIKMEEGCEFHLCNYISLMMATLQ